MKSFSQERWYEKFAFPKQSIHIMSTLAEYGKNAASTMLFFIKSMSYFIFLLVLKILTEP